MVAVRNDYAAPTGLEFCWFGLVGTARCAVPAGAVPFLASGTCPAEDGKAPDSGRRSAPVPTFPELASGTSEPPAKDWKARAGTAQRTVPTSLEVFAPEIFFAMRGD